MLFSMFDFVVGSVAVAAVAVIVIDLIYGPHKRRTPDAKAIFPLLNYWWLLN